MMRHSVRLLAPMALAAVAVGVYLVVHANVVTTHTTPARTANSPLRHGPTRHTARPRARFYTVRSGDTLSDIAARTKVTIGRLEALNPTLSPPYSLQTGQRLRLRR